MQSTSNATTPSSTFPTTNGVQFFDRMELFAIPQVPLWSFTGGRRSRSFRDGQNSLQIWILLSISGKEWRRKLGGPSRKTWRSSGMPARWPSLPSPTSSKIMIGFWLYKAVSGGSSSRIWISGRCENKVSGGRVEGTEGIGWVVNRVVAG